MAYTVEQLHNKISQRIVSTRETLQILDPMDQLIRGVVVAPDDTNAAKKTKPAGKSRAKRAGGETAPEHVITIAEYMRNECIAALTSRLDAIEANYKMGITPAVNAFYAGERNAANKYNQMIASENYASSVDDILYAAQIIAAQMGELTAAATNLRGLKQHSAAISSASKKIAAVLAGKIEIPLEKNDIETCKCGTKMDINSEESTLECPNPFCRKIRDVVGMVFRDDQFYTQDGQKAKHNGYDTSRHYRFWIDRLQAREVKTFLPEELDKIKRVIERDGYNPRMLQCKDMRMILKDPKVGLTHLNEHIPLLIKTFGGTAPPQLSFQDDQLLSTRFDNAMRLYDIVHPDSGNKPYYPYFIYKLVEDAFKNNAEKLRLLNYIHLQSRDTVIKNDIIYKQMAERSSPGDGIVYTPTDTK
jgi:uridine phosphorylase